MYICLYFMIYSNCILKNTYAKKSIIVLKQIKINFYSIILGSHIICLIKYFNASSQIIHVIKLLLDRHSKVCNVNIFNLYPRESLY